MQILALLRIFRVDVLIFQYNLRKTHLCQSKIRIRSNAFQESSTNKVNNLTTFNRHPKINSLQSG